MLTLSALFLVAAAPSSMEVLVDRAMRNEEAAYVELRAMGRAGFDALLARGDDVPDNVLDRVARQHNARASGLYWYTDMNEALAEAKRSHKPIISLKMLGNLDEELSCANSRFFRGLLYADPSVANTLRNKFVLHWESVRPVPVVTVDMGDGRSFKTTITGNSAHVVLNERGDVVDAIPGMYAPTAFIAALNRSLLIAKDCKDAACVAEAHRDDIAELDAVWARDMRALGRPEPKPQGTQRAEDESAEAIANRALAKAIVERPLLKSLNDLRREERSDDQLMREVGRLHEREVRWFGPALTKFVEGRSKGFASKLVTEISADTAQNEQQHHRTIHEWFVRRDGVTRDPALFTKAIYDTIFATPSSDPWLGLGDVRDGAVIR